MERFQVKKLFNKEAIEKVIIIIASIILIYLLITLYFNKHFFFHTTINEVDVSLKTKNTVNLSINTYIDNYKLQIIAKDGETEVITGQSIGMQCNDMNRTSNIYNLQNSFQWFGSLFKSYKYEVMDLYTYNEDSLNNRINELKFLNKNTMIEPQNVKFIYLNGCYGLRKEVYSNKIIKDRLVEAIKRNILIGKTKLVLDEKLYYKNPKYTLSSDKTMKTKMLLDKYVATIIVYEFGTKNEILDGTTINKWLSVDEELEVVINKSAVLNFVKQLCSKYDTVGITRKFKTSTGKIVDVKGGLYGWKINQDAETKAIIENIKLGEVIEKEPIYTRMALSRGEDEIGNTYVEINITKQHLWFYKDGTLLAEGPIVTGNPNRGNATVLGTYMLNYKKQGETLSGPGYDAKVTYWMPFYGNIGIHDASWRYSFGGEIYKTRGSHGCVNAPLQLAKIVFENIEEGIPIVCYEE